MSNRTIVCPLDELPLGTCKTVDTGSKMIAVFHHADGVHAIDDF